MINLTEFPEFKFDNFSLRQINPEKDYKRYYEYMSLPIVSEFIADNIKVDSYAKARRDLEYWHSLFHKGISIYWCIADEKDVMIGSIGFNEINKKEASISYDLDKEFWGLGIVRRAIDTICNFVQVNHGVEMIRGTVAKGNKRSINALEKSGFLFYRTLRAEIIDGNIVDSFEYLKKL